MTTFAEVVAAGLFDPDAADADLRRQLLERAIAVGAGLDEIRQASDEGWLHVVPTRFAILGGAPTLSVEEVAARAGIDADLAARLWDAARLSRRGDHECIDDDVAIFRVLCARDPDLRRGRSSRSRSTLCCERSKPGPPEPRRPPRPGS